jgi:hypothetical protein
VSPLVQSGSPESRKTDALRARLADLEAVLAAREAEYARIDSQLAAFKVKYRAEVGRLHEQLDELELAIAEAELGEIEKQIERGEREARSSSGAPADRTPRLTSDAVRRLFRDVAKAIHPDLARDDQARDRRHALMIEANRAYALGDEERLRSILLAWERSPEAVQGDDAAAARVRMERRIAQVEEQLDVYATDLAALQSSEIWKLKAMVDEAAARGRDLVGDMVKRLKRDVMVAQNRLEAIRSNVREAREAPESS